MTQEQTPRGRFLWYELATTDPDAARPFYRDIAGWEAETAEGFDPPYALWMTGAGPIGGLMQLDAALASQGVPPNWLPYIGTPDVDATVAEATRLGASVRVPPADIPDTGRFAVLADPQGAVFAVYTPATAAADDVPPGPGRITWHELTTSDHRGAFDFYAALFGWENTGDMDMGDAGNYRTYGLPGQTPGQMLGGMFDLMPGVSMPPYWMLYISVPDVSAALERVRALGGQVLNGPMEVPGGDVVAQCLDPQGAAFALHERKAQA